MKIVMVASESRPFCKTGGLADVVYSLSKELALLKHDVSVIIPFYQTVKNTIKTPVKLIDSFVINMSWRHQEAKVYETEADGVTFYLIEHYNLTCGYFCSNSSFDNLFLQFSSIVGYKIPSLSNTKYLVWPCFVKKWIIFFFSDFSSSIYTTSL